LSAAAWKTISGLKSAKRPRDALAVADIGKTAFDLHVRLFCSKGLQNRGASGFGIFHDEKTRGAECHDTVADFRADRAPPPVTMIDLPSRSVSMRP
jgi:hypothetical protein